MASPVLSCLEIWEEDVAFTSVTELQERIVVFVILLVVFLQRLQSVRKLTHPCWNDVGLDLSGIMLALRQFVPSLRWSLREGDARLVCGCSSHLVFLLYHCWLDASALGILLDCHSRAS